MEKNKNKESTYSGDSDKCNINGVTNTNNSTTLICKKKHQLKQIKFSQLDRRILFLPDLGDELEHEEFQMKKKYDRIILLSCVASFFSLRFSYELSKSLLLDEQEQTSSINQIISSSFFLFFSVISGLFIDVFSIQATWKYFSSVNCLHQLLQIIACLSNAFHLKLLGLFIYYSLLPICIINFTCILYESSGEFSTRLNNAFKLEVFGSMMAVVFAVTINISINDMFGTGDQANFAKKCIFLSGMCVCLLLNGGSVYVLFKTYAALEKTKNTCKQYRQFRISQGLFFSFLRLSKKLLNVDTSYVYIISGISGFLSQFVGFTIISQSTISNSKTILQFLITMGIGYLVIRYINTSNMLVTNSYKAMHICLQILAVASIVRILEVILLDKDIKYNSTRNEDDFSFESILNFLLKLTQGIIWLITYTLIHEIIIFLLHPRCAIRGISLAFIFMFYSLFYLLASSLDQFSLGFAVVQVVLSLFGMAASIVYMSKKDFTQLDITLPSLYEQRKQESV